MKDTSTFRLLESPWALGALATWAINDHVLKARFGNALTGKLSDVACLIVIPILVAGTAEMLGSKARQVDAEAVGRHVVLWSALGSCVVMALINTWPHAAAAYEIGLGALQWPFRAFYVSLAFGELTPFARVSLTMDPTDLLTCPASVVPLYLSRRRPK